MCHASLTEKSVETAKPVGFVALLVLPIDRNGLKPNDFETLRCISATLT